MNIKVSIIMPVYNAEKYLAKSIKSMLEQTLREIELILVNDGSNDASATICDEYSQTDNRIRVIHKKNEGACIARNIGISLAQGEYLQLVDADDYCELNMLEEQYELAKKTQAEVVMCGLKYDIHLKNGDILYELNNYKNLQLQGVEEIKHVMMDLIDNMLFNYTHNKLYKLDFLKKHQIQFIEWLPIDQDTNFNLDVFKHLNRLTLTRRAYYHYIKSFNETIVTRYHPDKFEVRTFRYERMRNLFKDLGINTVENKKKLASIYVHQVIECFEMYFHSKCSLNVKEKKQKIKELIIYKDVRVAMNSTDHCKSRYTNLIYYLMKKKYVFFIYLVVQQKCYIKKIIN